MFMLRVSKKDGCEYQFVQGDIIWGAFTTKKFKQ